MPDFSNSFQVILLTLSFSPSSEPKVQIQVGLQSFQVNTDACMPACVNYGDTRCRADPSEGALHISITNVSPAQLRDVTVTTLAEGHRDRTSGDKSKRYQIGFTTSWSCEHARCTKVHLFCTARLFRSHFWAIITYRLSLFWGNCDNLMKKSWST